MSKVFKLRDTAPASSDKNWIRWDKNGYNYCSQRTGNTVLPNCTGYAWGRWRELLGKFHELSRGDAEVWWGKQDGYKRGQTPKLGAVICWRKGIAGNKADGAGHVAIVEKINKDGSIVTSNSNYSGTVKNGGIFYMETLKPPFERKGLTLQGFIYIPVDYVEPTPKPEPKPDPKPTPEGKATIKEGAKYVSASAKYNGNPVSKDYIGKPLDYKLNKYAKQPSWVFFPVMNSYVDKKDVLFGKEEPKLKTNEEIAKEVWAGKWGNDPQRSKDLKKAGYDPVEIQKVVDATNPNNKPPKPSNKAGDLIVLKSERLYSTATTKVVYSVISGNYYFYDNQTVSGRRRITNSKKRVGVKGQVTGWIDA